jgi:hypothetical protein
MAVLNPRPRGFRRLNTVEAHVTGSAFDKFCQLALALLFSFE